MTLPTKTPTVLFIDLLALFFHTLTNADVSSSSKPLHYTLNPYFYKLQEIFDNPNFQGRLQLRIVLPQSYQREGDTIEYLDNGIPVVTSWSFIYNQINTRLLTVVDQATVLEAEGQRQSAILRAEGEKQALILQAEGKKEAAYRESEARERLAGAEATELVSLALKDGNIQAINYFVAQRYIDALMKTGAAENQKLVMLPLEATSILGSISGIAEIAKAAFTKEG